jgi:protein translocase SecG subunit
VAVLLQQAQGGAGAAFGQSDSFHSTRRGADRLLFNFTIIVAVAFFIVSIGTFKVTE